MLVYELSSKKKFILVSIKNNLKNSDIENLGAEFYKKVNFGKSTDYNLISDSVSGSHKNFLSFFIHGLKLKSYEFTKYKTKKETRVIEINIIGEKNKPTHSDQLKFRALEEGTFFARDLVSEPGNILHPDEICEKVVVTQKRWVKK